MLPVSSIEREWRVSTKTAVLGRNLEQLELVGRRPNIPAYGAKAFCERPLWPPENDHGDTEN
jgi:hypothetical protein